MINITVKANRPLTEDAIYVVKSIGIGKNARQIYSMPKG
jgi:hypothetical protein